MKKIIVSTIIFLLLILIPATSASAGSSPWINSMGCPSSATIGQSFNCNPSINGTVTYLRWTASGGSSSSGTGSTFSTSYNTTGTKTITLQACNVSGLTLCMSRTQNISINSANWTASLSASKTNPQANESITLTASTNSDVGPTQWFLVIYNASNGTVVKSCSSGTSCSTSVSYSGGTSYNYKALVSASNGTQAQATSNTVTITWSAPPPTLNTVGCPTSANQGQSFSCNPSTSGNITSRAWSALGGSPSSGSGSSFSTNFNSAGNKSISLTVCNSSTCISKSQSVTINSSQTKTLANLYVNQRRAQVTIFQNLWYLCGPSSTAMVLNRYGKSSDPNSDAGNTLKSMIDMNPSSRTYLATLWPKMSSALEARGVHNSGAGPRLTWDQIVAEIDANHPIIYGIFITAGGAHISEIVGYDKTDKTIIVNDPYGKWGWWTYSIPNTINTNDIDRGKEQKYYFDQLWNGSAGASFGNMMKTWV